MKNILILMVSFFLIPVFFACNKEESTTRIDLLTSHIWIADSLLVNGEDASGEGGFLEDFKGDTKFNADGTGYLGNVVGYWEFTSKETKIIITSDSLPFPVTTNIIELSASSLKLTTAIPGVGVINNIRMAFIPK